MALIRLDKFLCDLKIASRSEARDMIRGGRICVDGKPLRRPEQKIDPETAVVILDGEVLHYRVYHYFMMNKPEGVITATEDSEQQTVLDILPAELRRLGLFPVGRLDKDTGGLLLLTDDGDFAHRVISPKNGVKKRYWALVDGVPDEEDALAFRTGLELRDGTRCLPAVLEYGGGSECFVTVQEGKYHQVRRMLAARGKTVLRLRRLSIGALQLDDKLAPGGLRELTAEELFTVFMDR